MQIEVLQFRNIDSNNPSLKALVDLKIGELKVFDFRIIEGKMGELFVRGPRVTYKDHQTSGLIHKSVVSMPASMWKEITELVLTALEKKEQR